MTRIYRMNLPPSSRHPPTDCHFHVFNAGQSSAPGARYTPTYDASLQHWQAQASAHGITRGVLVQPSFLGTDNRLLVQTLLAHPAQLRGVAVVAADADISTLRPLHEAGVRAIRLNLAGTPHTMGPWQVCSALWSALEQLGWHVEIHTDAGALPVVLAQLPATLPVVLDHMAKPASLAGNDPTFVLVRQRAHRSPVHIKLSGAYRQAASDTPALCQRWLDVLGPGALVWGSDWPFTNHEASIHYQQVYRQFDDWVPADATRLATCENPARLYGFEPLP
jgi:predicted TIM-barrel fold metal-dependent hydrolase